MNAYYSKIIMTLCQGLVLVDMGEDSHVAVPPPPPPPPPRHTPSVFNADIIAPHVLLKIYRYKLLQLQIELEHLSE